MPNNEKKYLTLQELFALSVQHNLPFAVYRVPGENMPSVVLQLTSKLNLINKNENIFNSHGFVVKPFKETSTIPSVLISPDLHFTGYQISFDKIPATLISQIESENSEFSIGENHSKSIYEAPIEEFGESVNKIKNEIKQGTITKAVLSRIHLKDVNSSFSPVEAFHELIANHTTAFVYLVHLPGIGIWMGASPELLLSIKGNSLKTVSLAGTQKANDLSTFSWGNKELHEQQIVTDHIKNCLEKYFSRVEITGPETTIAGPVAHLKTHFKTEMGDKQSDILDQLIRELNPTPALSGMPKEAAVELINDLEKHDREYYTGYLGPVNMNNKTQLFINLRCMKLLKNEVAIYVGAGITAGSDPQLEWEETQMKANAMLKVLNTKSQYVG